MGKKGKKKDKDGAEGGAGQQAQPAAGASSQPPGQQQQQQQQQPKKQRGQQQPQRQDSSASGSSQSIASGLQQLSLDQQQQPQRGAQQRQERKSEWGPTQQQQGGAKQQQGGAKQQKQTQPHQQGQPQQQGGARQQQQSQPKQQWGPQSQQSWGPGGQQQQVQQPQQQGGARQQQQSQSSQSIASGLQQLSLDQQQQPQRGAQQRQERKSEWGPTQQQQGGAKQQQGGAKQQKQTQPHQQGQPQQQGGARQQQQSQPKQQWGPQSQQSWGPGGQQQQVQQPQQQGGARQQQQSQPKQQWGQQPQQSWGPGGQQQQVQQPQQQWTAGQQQGGARQQQQSQPKQQWGQQPQQSWGPGGQQQVQQQQHLGAGPQQQSQPQQSGAVAKQPMQQQQQRGGEPKQQWGPGGQQQQVQQPQQQRRGESQEQKGGTQPPQKQQQESSKKKVGGILGDYCMRSSPLKNIQKWQGTVGSQHVIEVNYMKMNLEKIPKKAYQYRVDFNLERPTRFRPVAFEQFRRIVLSGNKRPGFPIAFDARNIAFSACKVPDRILNEAHTVQFVDVETNVQKEIVITMKEADDLEVDLSSLFNYHQTGITNQPLRAMQCIDVVLRSAPAGRAKLSGRAFYVQPNERNLQDLGDIFVLWQGLHQSVVLGDYPMFNIDIANRAFAYNYNLVDAYEKLGNYKAPQVLRGMTIIYDPPSQMNGTRKLYKINELVESARTYKFKDQDGKEWTIEKYYQSKNVQLKRPDLPCVSVGTVRRICLPLEFCNIEPGQDCRRKTGPDQTRALIKCAATPTTIRKQNIMRIFTSFEYNTNEIVRGFGLSLIPEFVKVMARLLPAPTLLYARGNARPDKGSWRAGKFLQSAPVHKWGVLVTADRVPDSDIMKLMDQIKFEAGRCNMNIESKGELIVEKDRRAELTRLEKLKSLGCSIVFVVISDRDKLSYARIKQAAEIKLKMVTQCIKSTTLRRIEGMTISNIFLKVNSKLNGVNHQIQPAPILQPLMSKVPAMFLGADVTHPSPDQSSIPSIVGVVASHDDLAFQYNACFRLQDPRAEMICDMEAILVEQLNFFRLKRKELPAHIIYYRDGVSNGQFPELEQIELRAIDRACAKIDQKYRPKITCLIVQKRHHTRFFPQVPSNIVHPRDRNQNVLPGTVIDTVITHPGEKQFFLVSHESIQGTAKPSKYCIIRDDANFAPDQLQAITYALCHMFTRCNRAVSYPAPAYYAHLMAARGRALIEGQNVNCRQLPREYDIRRIDELRRSNPMFFV